ncbi:MAG TPA: cell division protein ZapA [Acidobacteriaceae bacterium]|jgi:cell division protein ZapA|nr:cell division protein ZapA [Acidobacteriaceae bacterium]
MAENDATHEGTTGMAGGTAESQAITVEIYDQTYRLRGSDQAYVERLAALVDGKMRAVAAGGRTVDSLRVAVLAALNMADELTRLEERYTAVTRSGDSAASMRSRAHSLTGLLDEVLAAERKAG